MNPYRTPADKIIELNHISFWDKVIIKFNTLNLYIYRICRMGYRKFLIFKYGTYLKRHPYKCDKCSRRAYHATMGVNGKPNLVGSIGYIYCFPCKHITSLRYMGLC